MKKPITKLLLFLFSIAVMAQASENLAMRATADGSLPAIAEKATSIPPAPASFAPEDVGMNSVTLARIDAIVKEGMQAKAFPGCQVLVLKEGKPIYDKCFGNYTYSESPKVTPTTMYDLASLSKTTGTLLAIMKLYDTGKLQLADKASKYLTFLRGTDKENITITELLFHESGLPASLPFHRLPIEKTNTPPFLTTTKDTTQVPLGENMIVGSAFKYKEGWVSRITSLEYTSQVSDSFYVHNRFHEAAMQMIARTRLNSKAYVYSCVNFILLKEIAETISGTSMDVFLDQEYYASMKLTDLAYLPLRTHKKEEIAPTLRKDYLRGNVVQGFVHDPDAAFLGGVSGNAGLFASAGDVAKVYQMLLNKGELDGKRYLSEETCKVFTTTTSPSGRRGLGYDKPVPAPRISPCSPSAPSVVYGHTGYTGTCTWVDPANKLVYVFLSNRTYPNDGVNKLAKMGIRTKIQEVIYQSMK